MKISETGYGVDVAVRRIDDLDRAALAYVEELRGDAQVLELGAGAGGFAARLAAAGAHVTAVDMHDFSQQYEDVEQVSFMCADLCEWDRYLTQPYDLVVMQRTLHYVPYTTAVDVLTRLRRHGITELYLSCSGVASALGAAYPASMLPVSERFAQLTEDAQTTFGITAPVCLYRPEDVRALLESSGWQLVRLWESAFGNIKATARQ